MPQARAEPIQFQDDERGAGSRPQQRQRVAGSAGHHNLIGSKGPELALSRIEGLFFDRSAVSG